MWTCSWTTPFLILLHFQLFFNLSFPLPWTLRLLLYLWHGEGSQSGLCVGQSPGPVCLATLMSTAARLNIVLTFSYINVAEELSFSKGPCMHALLMHTDSYSQKHTHTVPPSHNCSESTRTDTKTNQKVAYCIVYPRISHSHTQTHPQTTHCTQRGRPQISPGLTQHTPNSTVVENVQVLSRSAPDVQPQD